MSGIETIVIKTDQPFEHLPKAPIVEAVIDIRARAGVTLDEALTRAKIEPKLDGYHYLDARHEFEFESQINLKGNELQEQKVRDLGLKGIRFASNDTKHVVQFNRDGFVFSRLEPYVDWGELSGNALRLWSVHKELACPHGIQRIGLRFINRILIPQEEFNLDDYLVCAPTMPEDLELPFDGFLYRDTFSVPGHPYAINRIRTVQHSPNYSGQQTALIVDIDVFTTRDFDPDESNLIEGLNEMRWLKNKTFFGSVTRKAMEMFR